jgi:hypothetical protein
MISLLHNQLSLNMNRRQKYYKIFFMSNFSYLFICNPTYKTQTKITNRLGITNNTTPKLMVMIDELKVMSSNEIIFIIIFYVGACNSQVSLGPKLCMLIT